MQPEASSTAAAQVGTSAVLLIYFVRSQEIYLQVHDINQEIVFSVFTFGIRRRLKLFDLTGLIPTCVFLNFDLNTVCKFFTALPCLYSNYRK